jgi:hypothetical protein
MVSIARLYISIVVYDYFAMRPILVCAAGVSPLRIPKSESLQSTDCENFWFDENPLEPDGVVVSKFVTNGKPKEK